MKSLMFDFVGPRWNPYCMRCPHGCFYCWAEALKAGKLKDAERYVKLREDGQPFMVQKEFRRRFKHGETVFVEDMGDLFAQCVPDAVIWRVFKFIEEHEAVTFLLMTKNPARYVDLYRNGCMPKNVIYGTTIESDLNYPEISLAPPQSKRLLAIKMMHDLNCRIFISIEPILDFGSEFVKQLRACGPWAVAVGYDNYAHKLTEPALAKTEALIRDLEMFTRVCRKTLRKAHWET